MARNRLGVLPTAMAGEAVAIGARLGGGLLACRCLRAGAAAGDGVRLGVFRVGESPAAAPRGGAAYLAAGEPPAAAVVCLVASWRGDGF